MSTRVMVIADMHCGHKVGLTPPDWDMRPGEGYGEKAYDLWRARRKMWRSYANWCAELKPDVLIVNGDAIDGKGDKSGARELLTADRDEQCGMAIACICETKAKDVVMSFGTPYHTGRRDDWEKKIANKLECKIGGEDEIKVHGVVLNYRHFTRRSSVPYGRGTPLAKERFWNLLWSVRGEYPRADIVIRSHIHYFSYIGGPDWLAMVTPGLQGYGSIFGTRIMTGTVDFGVVYFDISENGKFEWGAEFQRFNHKNAYALDV